MSASTPESRCPRCGAAFHCGAQQARCDCFELRLSDGLRVELAQQYPGRCLCLDCLRSLSVVHSDPKAG
ncbi:MAG: cysteine-rich CWC family protein [Inhella sp.]